MFNCVRNMSFGNHKQEVKYCTLKMDILFLPLNKNKSLKLTLKTSLKKNVQKK